MPQLYITAIIFSLVALLIFWGATAALKPETPRKWLWLLLLCELPMEPLSFYAARMPFDHWFFGVMGKTPLYVFCRNFYAPVTEEFAKLIPIIAFFLAGKIRKDNFRDWFLAIGFGFGIGEAWTVAHLIVNAPGYTELPFYDYSPFLGERMEVCFLHAAFTGAGLYLSVGRDLWAPGTLLSMTLHFLLNFPIYLLPMLGWSRQSISFGITMQLWTVAWTLVAIYFIIGKDGAQKLGTAIFGRAKCPRCEAVYERSLWGFNLGPRRYEKCPQCKTWNITSEYKEGAAK